MVLLVHAIPLLVPWRLKSMKSVQLLKLCTVVCHVQQHCSLSGVQ